MSARPESSLQTPNASPPALLHASLEVLVLALLADGPQYGYSLLKQIADAGDHETKPGTLYPLLHRMEADGWITPSWEKNTGRPRKWYTLTPAGQKALTRRAADWQAALARMQAVVLPALRRVTRYPHPLTHPA